MNALVTLAAMLWFSGIFFVGMPWVLLRATGVNPLVGWRASGATGPLAVGACVLGLLWLIVFFVREGDGTPVPLAPPRRFVERGVFRLTRNPMYLAYTALLLSEACLYRSAALLGWAFVFLAIAHLYVTRVEEPALALRFGAAYTRYCSEVPRWIRPLAVPRQVGGALQLPGRREGK